MNLPRHIHEELRAIDVFWDHPARLEAPYSVPAGYFDHPDALVALAAREGSSVPEFAVGTGATNAQVPEAIPSPYRVPDHYFEHLGPALLATIQQQENPQKINMPLTRKLYRYAAAAVLLGVMLGTGWIFRNAGSSPPGSSAVALIADSIADEELVQFLNQESSIASASFAESVEKLSLTTNAASNTLLADVTDRELEEFINNPAETIPNLMN